MFFNRQKTKQMISLILVATILFGGLLTQVVMADEVLSIEERRKLAQFPELTLDQVLSGKFKKALEVYLSDAFPFRSVYRKIKAAAVLQLFGKIDLNGLYLEDGHLSKIEAELDEKQIAYVAKRIEQIRQEYLQNMNVYYAVIPDKHYFLGASGDYPTMDYEKLMTLFDEKLPEIEGIDLFDVLKIEDYYFTDPHLKQEALEALISNLSESMDFSFKPLDQYDVYSYGDFYGAYAGQIGLNVPPDRLNYLIDEVLKSIQVYDVEKDAFFPIYQTESDLSMDAYSLYLGGPSAIQVMENPNANTGKELILFRDSFGSAIAPMMLSGYDKITLIDLRYVSGEILDQYVTFENQEVLFLYSTSIINGGGALFK